MRIIVDYDRCEANALCQGIAPEVFEVDEDDILHLKAQPTAGTADLVRYAVATCPRGALSLRDQADDGGLP